MIFRVGIENNNEGFRSIAWALEHPGCFAYGKDQEEATRHLPAAIRAYVDWIAQHEPAWLDTTEIELTVEDIWTAFCVDEAFERVETSDNEINAWFQHDWTPLTADDIQRGLKILGWARQDLLQILHSLTADQWAYKAEGERWDVTGIVKHIAVADWWYVDRLGLAFPRAELPSQPLERLEKSRALMCETLQKLEGVEKVVGTHGEFWSPRKVLRRATWHERDHTEHIRKLLHIPPTF